MVDNAEDFSENDSSEVAEGPPGEAPIRIRRPREGEFIGLIVQRLGGNRMEVRCTDGKTRNCRVPGRFKRSMWLRPGDIVLVQPWEFDNDKADIVFQYHTSAINQLRKRGMLDKLQDDF